MRGPSPSFRDELAAAHQRLIDFGRSDLSSRDLADLETDRKILADWANDDRAEDVWAKISPYLRENVTAVQFISKVLLCKFMACSISMQPPKLRERESVAWTQLRLQLRRLAQPRRPPPNLTHGLEECLRLARAIEIYHRIHRSLICAQDLVFDEQGLAFRLTRTTEGGGPRHFMRGCKSLLQNLCERPLPLIDDIVATLTEIVFQVRDVGADRVRNTQRPTTRRGRQQGRK